MEEENISTTLLSDLWESHIETIFHPLMDCKSTREIWTNTQFAAEIRIITDQDIFSILH